MLQRIAKLLRIKTPSPITRGYLDASGATVPVDGTDGYQTGCIFKHTDGAAEGAVYVNEGSVTSCAFVPLLTTSNELQDLPDFGAMTYGAGKILVADGDSFEEVAVSGNLALTSAGSATVQGAVTGLSRLTVTTAPTAIATPSLCVGAPGAKVVDAVAGDDNAAFYVGMSTATNKSVANTSCLAAYIQVANTAATTNTRLQGALVSTSIGGNCFDAYAVQGHTTVEAAGMSTQNANAHITGLSGKAVLTGAVGQGWVTGVLAIVEGAGAVTGLCHVIAGQLEATATDSVCDALLFLGADALATSAIEVADVAHVTNLLKLNAASGCIVAGDVNPHAAPDGDALHADKLLRITLDGTPYYIPIFDTLVA